MLNIGKDIIPGAIELLSMAAKKNKPVLVVTNGATQNEQMIGLKYADMGLRFSRRKWYLVEPLSPIG